MTETTTKIEEETRRDGGAFVIRRDDGAIAEITYRRESPGVVAANRTFVDASLRGQGIAGKLLDALVSWAREGNEQVIAECSYVAAALEKRPGLADTVVVPSR